MKEKTSNSVILFILVGSVLFGAYLLIPEKIELSKAKSSGEISETNKDLKTDSHNFESTTIDFENQPVSLSSPYDSLNRILTTLKSDDSIHLPNLTALAHCVSCLDLLQTHLILGNFSEKQLKQLANLLSRSNHPELAGVLINSLVKIPALNDDSNEAEQERRNILLNGISQFNSPQIAKYFTDYQLENKDLSAELRNAMNSSINDSPKRSVVATEIVARFKSSNDSEEQAKLLAINQPESLAKIGAFAREQGNSELYEKATEQIKSNPSKNTFDVFLDMANNATNYEDVEAIKEMAKQWGYQQLSGNRLDYIEKQLIKGQISNAEAPVIAAMLENSEDEIRGKAILNKFGNKLKLY